ncbi:MAG: DUF4403 family protein [Aureispira sp.]|nr:DUF4403 family protein [Aureispira sp.]
MKLYVYLLSLVLLSACSVAKRPPQEVAPVSIPQLKDSHISLPIHINMNELEKSIWKQIEQPILKGETGTINAQILAQKAIKETKKSWVASLLRYVTKTVTKWIDKSLNVELNMEYNVRLESLDLDINKDVLETRAKTKVFVKMSYQQNALPFGESYKINGNLSCTVDAIVSAKGKIKVGNRANLVIELPKEGGHIKFTKICVPSAVQGVDMATQLMPILNPIKEKLGSVLDKILTKQLSKALAQHAGNLDFREQIIGYVADLDKPQELSTSVWLLPNIKRILLSNPKGENGDLVFCVGAVCNPKVTYSAAKPPKPKNPAQLWIQKVKEMPEETSLMVDARYRLDQAASQLKTYLKEYVEKEQGDLAYTIGTVEIFPSNERAVVSVGIEKKKTQKTVAYAYVSGIPAYDPKTMEIYLDELEFTTKSKNVLLKFFAAFSEKKILKQLKEAARFSIESNKKEVLTQLKKIEYNAQEFYVNGGFQDIDVAKVFIDEKHCVAYLKTKGKLALTYKP